MIVGVYATSKTSYRGGFAQAKPPLAVARSHRIRSKIEAHEHEIRQIEETRSKNRKQTAVFCLQYLYRILFEKQNRKQKQSIHFQTESGLFSHRKWPTFDAQMAHLRDANGTLIKHKWHSSQCIPVLTLRKEVRRSVKNRVQSRTRSHFFLISSPSLCWSIS